MANLAVRLVEGGRQMLLGDGHPDGVRDALAERSSRHLHAGGDEVFRVPGGHRVRLSEVFEVIHRDAEAVVVGLKKNKATKQAPTATAAAERPNKAQEKNLNARYM